MNYTDASAVVGVVTNNLRMGIAAKHSLNILVVVGDNTNNGGAGTTPVTSLRGATATWQSPTLYSDLLIKDCHASLAMT